MGPMRAAGAEGRHTANQRHQNQRHNKQLERRNENPAEDIEQTHHHAVVQKPVEATIRTE